MKAKPKPDPKEQQIAELLEQAELLRQKILEIESEPPADPVENHRRAEHLRKLRRERALVSRLATNLQVFRLGGTPRGIPR